MTPFKKNITKSIDNLNRICKTILSIYDNKTIDKMLTDNVLNQSGSDLTFNNTLAGGKFDWEIQGKCEQDTTTGKNKLNIPNGTYTGTNGVTAVANNGEITLNGTATNNSFIYIPFNYELAIETTYSWSANNTNANANVLLRFDSNTMPKSLENVNETQSYTVGQTAVTITQFVIRIASGTTLTNFVIKPQLEIGNPTSYEQYTGGIPSPNPDYPQSIRVVTGDNDVVVQNKNYFELSNVTETPGTTETAIGKIDLVTNGFRLTKTVESGDGHGRFTPYINLKMKAGTYKVVGTLNKSANINNCYIGFKNNSTTMLTLNTQTINTNFTLNFDETDVRFYMNANADLNDYIEFTNLMFINSTETDLTYVEGQSQTVTLHLGPEYLAGIDTYIDGIVGKKDNWKIIRNQSKIIADGVNLKADNVRESGGLYYTSIIVNDLVGQNKKVILGTHFIAGIQADYRLGVFYILPAGNRLVFVQTNQTLDTKGKVDTWLQAQATADTPVTFYCALNTPTETPVSDTTLISDLNNMYNLLGYDGQTNISIVPAVGNAIPSLKVTAFVTEKEV